MVTANRLVGLVLLNGHLSQHGRVLLRGIPISVGGKRTPGDALDIYLI
jgi:hypothetical protein